MSALSSDNYHVDSVILLDKLYIVGTDQRSSIR